MIRSIGRTWDGPAAPRLRILGPEWREPARSRLKRVAETAGCDLTFFVAPDAIGYPLDGHYSQTVYARLAVAEACPGEAIVACLDSDIVALASLASLLETDLRGHPVAATNDRCVEAELPTPSGRSYFNAGVLLVDVPAWDRYDIAEACRRLLRRGGQTFTYLDQDALNQVLTGDWHVLDATWNVFHYTELRKLGQLPATLTDEPEWSRLLDLQTRARLALPRTHEAVAARLPCRRQ